MIPTSKENLTVFEESKYYGNIFASDMSDTEDETRVTVTKGASGISVTSCTTKLNCTRCSSKELNSCNSYFWREISNVDKQLVISIKRLPS